jgi:hypothetical protein
METTPDRAPAPTPTGPACPNCGADTHGDRFCGACGQRQAEFRQPVHILAKDLLAEYFGLEGKLWRTAVALLRPGFLTVEYLEGRQRQYARPLRLYLTASLVFFFTVTLLDPGERLRQQILGDEDPAEQTVREALARLDADAEAARERRAGLEGLAAAGVTLVPDSLRGGGFKVRVGGQEVQSEQLRQLQQIETREDAARVVPGLVQAVISRVPNAMFLVLPVFALLLKLLYVRRKRYYGEHLVFAFHVHAFWFACFTLLAVLGTLLGDLPGFDVVRDGGAATGAVGWAGPAADALSVVMAIGLPAYTVLAMRRVYGQGWGKTLVKAWALWWAYGGVLILTLVGVALATVVG